MGCDDEWEECLTRCVLGIQNAPNIGAALPPFEVAVVSPLPRIGFSAGEGTTCSGRDGAGRRGSWQHGEPPDRWGQGCHATRTPAPSLKHQLERPRPHL